MEIELSDLQEQRRVKADQFRELGIDPYPTRSSRTHTTAEALAEFERTESNEVSGESEPITLGGRIVSRRHMGKTLFAHIRDGHGQLQLYIRKDELGEETYNQALKLFDLGDWVQATGE